MADSRETFADAGIGIQQTPDCSYMRAAYIQNTLRTDGVEVNGVRYFEEGFATLSETRMVKIILSPHWSVRNSLLNTDYLFRRRQVAAVSCSPATNVAIPDNEFVQEERGRYFLALMEGLGTC